MGPAAVLKALGIRDLAILRSVDLEFEAGLTVITGETGAGKSILVDAVGLALGDRADSGAVRAGAERATVSALFDLTARPDLLALLAEQGIDAREECVVRRVVGADGRSRAFCNDAPVSVQFLKTLGDRLVDIHGQHAHHSLLERTNQRALLDEFGDQLALARKVAAAYRRWHAVEAELAALRGGHRDAASRIEFLRFQLDELAQLPVSAAELTALEAAHRRAANGERLRNGIATIAQRVFGGERSARAALAQAAHAARELAGLDDGLQTLAELMEQASINLDEAERELDHYSSRLGADAGELARAERALEEIHAVARKHRCLPAELAEVRTRLEGELATLLNHETLERELAARGAEAEAEYRREALALSQRRRAAAGRLAAAVIARLHELALPHARFEIEIAESAAPGEHGLDDVEFTVTTNPDLPPRPLRKVASGGELSRVSLALQVAAAGVSGVPVVVYDEVDTGVGGRVAAVLARLLKAIAGHRQVLCITHLPQVAAAGDRHLQIGKSVKKGATETSVRYLDAGSRVEEIARMLGGEEITKKTVAHAKELLGA
ncbi:MAG TPA: DNA repair protein RecN [Gammaproteobacteria bacterium]|nr:DNA repair protein RecN [Gammaproteobacteria bacterium]